MFVQGGLQITKLQLVYGRQWVSYGNGKKLKDLNQNNEIEILKTYNFEFIRILESPSLILLGKSRIWELLRGIYNENFNSLTKKKEEKALIKRLWNFTYEELKQRIWIPCCDEIKRSEDRANIKKLDLRKKSEMVIEDSEKEKDGENKIIKKKKIEKNLEKINKKKLTQKLIQ